VNQKNPETYDELKQIAKDYFFERADHLNNLKPEVKLELCNLLSDTSNVILGIPYRSGLCETFASPNPAPHIPWEECKYVKDRSSGTTINNAAQVGSNFVMQAELAKDQVVLGDNQTIKVHAERVFSNATMQNITVRITMSDSTGKAIYSTQGKTDVGGYFYDSWVVDTLSPNSFYTVTVMAKDPAGPNWSSGTLYFNRTPDQIPDIRICPWDDQTATEPEQPTILPSSPNQENQVKCAAVNNDYSHMRCE
jgi:hypothetical protein